MIKLKVCKGCHTPITRKRLRNGRIEHKAHFEKKIFHDMHCRQIYSTRRPTRKRY